MSTHLTRFALSTALLGFLYFAGSNQQAQAQAAFNEKEYNKAKKLTDSLLIKRHADVAVALFTDFFEFIYPIEQAPGFPGELSIAEAPEEISKDLLFIPKPDIIHFEDEDLVYDYVPKFADDVLEDRLSCLSGSIPLAFNPQVRGFIDYFALKRRDYTLRMLGKKNVFFPLFEKYLKEYGIPDELKYLSIVESALNPKARSRAGAVGLWQFMPATGQMMGLKQNNYVDERMDPEKATIAACKYLLQLYNYFGQNWELALAAYNSGPGTVQRAIRRSGGKTDFWKIYHLLPAETRSYVPMFTAVTYIMHYAEEHNLIQDQPYYSIPYATVSIDQTLNVKALAQKLNICTDDLEELNPELKKGVVPPTGSYALRIPADRAEYFYQNKWEILESSRTFSRDVPAKRQNKYARYANANRSEAGEVGEELEVSNKRTTTRTTLHTIRKGESLGLIAQRNGVSVKQLRQWNHLSGNKLIAGKKLKIIKAVKGAVEINDPENNGELLAVQKSSASKRDSKVIAPAGLTKNQKAKAEIPKAAVKPLTENKKNGESCHVIRSGDSLWAIAQKYGLNVEQLKKLNAMRDNKIKIGQKLKVG